MSDPQLSTDPIDWSCTRCHSQLVDSGTVDFRVGGQGGGMTFLFGGWAELGEGKIDLRLLACPRCGQLALFKPELYPPTRGGT